MNIKNKINVVWLWGLSGSGKSTLANLLNKKLIDTGIISIILDGDEIRKGVNKDLTFSQEDRAENIRRSAEFAKITSTAGIFTICCFITPLKKHRELFKEILGNRVLEVYLKCPIDTCNLRDVKGLYQKAKKKELLNFTGIDSSFELPVEPDLTLETNVQTPEQSLYVLYNKINDDLFFST